MTILNLILKNRQFKARDGVPHAEYKDDFLEKFFNSETGTLVLWVLRQSE